MLNQAEVGRGPWRDALSTIAKQSLNSRIRFHKDKPLWGFTGQLTDGLAVELLEFYEQLQPKLRTDSVATPVALWVLIVEVFVPTLFVKLVRDWQEGSGDEFQGASCWYLPSKEKGQRMYPAARVFRFWLRAIGFRYAHDLGKALGDSARRKAERWLKGDGVPKIRELHALVDKFAKESQWADRPDVWKTRFTLACAADALCVAMDSFFEPTRPDSSLEISRMLISIEQERTPMDDNRILAESRIFFAARLFHLRLMAEGRWDAEVVEPSRNALNKIPPPGQSDEEMEQFCRERQWGMNQGNWLLESIKREVDAKEVNGAMHAAEMGSTLQERIMNWGAEELNRILEEKGRRAVRSPTLI